MIKVSHEVPICLLEHSLKFNHYDYCLPHLLDQNEQYREFFYKSKAEGRYIIMDNSLHELGKETARATIAFAYPFAIIASIAVVLASGAPESVALRIGFASATAYAVGTLLDVYVFQHIRERWTNNWWAAPAISTVAANIIDTYTFFSVAFHGSEDAFMSQNWMLVAHSQVGIKIAIGLIIFLPLYGVFLNYLKRYLNDKRTG